MNLLKVKELPQGFVLKEVNLGVEGEIEISNILGMVSPSLPLKLSFENSSNNIRTRMPFSFEILAYDTVKFVVEFTWKENGVQKRYFHICSTKESVLTVTPCLLIGNQDATITFYQVQED